MHHGKKKKKLQLVSREQKAGRKLSSKKPKMRIDSEFSYLNYLKHMEKLLRILKDN